MPEIDEESVKFLKRFAREDFGVEYTDDEAGEAARNLFGFYGLLLKIRIRNDEQLKKSTKK